MNKAQLLLSTLLLTLPLASVTASNWTITDLGALGAEGSLIYTSEGLNINNYGQVAGTGVVLTNGVREMHYVVWSNGTQIDLGINTHGYSALTTAPINEAGQVAGWIQDEDGRPFIWQNGVITRLPWLPNTVNGCRVTGINASGAIVGDNGVQRWWGVERVSVIWQGGTVTDLSLPYGSVTAINDSGAIAIGAGAMRQRSYVLTGGATNIVDWPGMDPVTGTTKALDLNNAGQVCGWYIADPSVDGSERALLWQVGGGTFLPNFPINSRSQAVALNIHGHAVGWAYRAGNDAPAVLWRDGTLTALDSMPEVVAAGWSGLTARDINDYDQIVGSGYHNGVLTAFLLTPVVPPQPFTFTTNTVPVGNGDSGPDCLATADVNGDGRLDLISANYGFRWANPGEPGGWGTNLVVLTNNGSGGFALNATLPVGAGPSSVVGVDIDGDGKPDVISANQTANTLTLLTNGGNGFGWHATLAVSGAPSSLVAADVNGDWSLDLACARSGANSVTVLTNNGRGLFTLQGAFAVGAKPIFLVTTDVNGDARPDLVSVNHDANSLTVLTNNGSGFGFNATLPVGSIPVAAAAGDVNRDGRPDLVSVNWGANTLTVLTNNGAGSFSASATLPVGTTPSSVAVGDFNGDGAVDLICANTSAGADNSLTVFTNSGSGGFGFQTTLALGNIPTSLLAADVNSDGRLDVNFLNFRDGTLTVLLNTTAFPPAFSSRMLDISRRAGGVRVAWPSASPGWSLQQKRTVTAPNWLPSGHDGYPFTDDRTNNSLTLPAANAGLFFRLQHP